MGRYRLSGDKKRVNKHRYAVGFGCLTFDANGRFRSKAVIHGRQQSTKAALSPSASCCVFTARNGVYVKCLLIRRVTSLDCYQAAWVIAAGCGFLVAGNPSAF
jgi:hypothetical protein